jgi:putative tryptophan/tyrosine transport system substrate-binding protein
VKRRTFISLLGGAAAWPLAARAQKPALPVIGFLNSASPELFVDRTRAFYDGLSQTGFVEGQNVGIEYRWAGGQYDRLPALARDLVRRDVVLIAAIDGTASALAAKAATTTIPIVFRTGADPVAAGLVASLGRPGGNVTGVTSLNVEVSPKRLELLHELIRKSVMAALINPAGSGAKTQLTDLQAAAANLGLKLNVFHASTDRELAVAFASVVQSGAAGLVIGPDVFFGTRNEQLASLALSHSVPTIYQWREFAAAGGLMSYGGSLADQYRMAGIYTGRVLRGEHPADLPVQQSTKVELIINLKTAKALGLMVPLPLLGRADEVIE